jgi:hypothetical protein
VIGRGFLHITGPPWVVSFGRSTITGFLKTMMFSQTMGLMKCELKFRLEGSFGGTGFLTQLLQTISSAM